MSGVPTQLDPAPDYSAAVIGGEISGWKVAHIYVKTKDAIVYANDRHKTCYAGAVSADAVREHWRLTLRAAAVLKGAYDRDLQRLLGITLATSLEVPPDHGAVAEACKTVDEFIDSHAPVRHVFSVTREWAVFLDRENNLVCTYTDVTPQNAPIMAAFHRYDQVGRSVLRGSELQAFHRMLGAELAVALAAPSPDTESAFSYARDFLQPKLESQLQTRYVSASVVIAVLFAVAVISLDFSRLAFAGLVEDALLRLGILGGIVGATLSVLQRTHSIQVVRFVPSTQLYLQGATRVVLGAIFGALLVAAAGVGLVLPKFAADPNAVFLGGVVAGLSERFIPDLLKRAVPEPPVRASNLGA